MPLGGRALTVFPVLEVRAASALARECDVLAGRGREGGKGSRSKTGRAVASDLTYSFVHSANTAPPPCGRA